MAKCRSSSSGNRAAQVRSASCCQAVLAGQVVKLTSFCSRTMHQTAQEAWQHEETLAPADSRSHRGESAASAAARPGHQDGCVSNTLDAQWQACRQLARPGLGPAVRLSCFVSQMRVSDMSKQMKQMRGQLESDEQLKSLMAGLRGSNVDESDFADKAICDLLLPSRLTCQWGLC